jgi:hypothetical protein
MLLFLIYYLTFSKKKKDGLSCGESGGIRRRIHPFFFKNYFIESIY